MTLRTKLALELAQKATDICDESTNITAARDAIASLIDSRILGPLREKAHAQDPLFESTKARRCLLCDKAWNAGWEKSRCTCPFFADLDDPPEAEGGAIHA